METRRNVMETIRDFPYGVYRLLSIPDLHTCLTRPSVLLGRSGGWFGGYWGEGDGVSYLKCQNAWEVSL